MFVLFKLSARLPYFVFSQKAQNENNLTVPYSSSILSTLWKNFFLYLTYCKHDKFHGPQERCSEINKATNKNKNQ